MKDKLQESFRGLYWRQFGVIAGMVLLTLLGVVVSIEFFSEYLRKKLS